MATVVNSAEGSWSLADVKNRKKVVTSKTATYKVNNKAVAVIKGLNTSVTSDNVADLLNVTAGTNGGAGTITIKDSALNSANAVLTLSNGGSYALALGSDVTEATSGNYALNFANTVSKGTATVTADLTQGYTLTNAKTISYTAAATGATMATVSGLNKAATTSEKVSLVNQNVRIFKDAFTTSNVTLANSSAATALGLDYSLALSADEDSDDDGKVGFEKSKNYWTVTPNNKTLSKATSATATYKYYTDAGYTLTNAKKITYTKAAETTIATIAGLDPNTRTSTSTTSGNTITEDTATARASGNNIGVYKTEGEGEEATTTFTQGVTVVDSTTDSDGNVTAAGSFTLKDDVLSTNNITLGLGKNQSYALALAGEVNPVTIEVSGVNWNSKKATATVSGTMSEGYTLTNDKTVVYSKGSTSAATLATITGLKAVPNSTAVNNNNKTVTLSTAELSTGTAKISSNYGLTLVLNNETPTSGVAEKDKWVVNKTTATYEKVKPLYYTLAADGKSVSYTGETVKETHATIAGLKSVKGAVLTTTTDGDGNSVLGIKDNAGGITEAGVKVDSKNGTITLPAAVLTTTKVTLTDGTSDTNYVLDLAQGISAPALDESTTKWALVKSVPTYTGTVNAGYTLADDKLSVTYTSQQKSKVLATLTGLNSNVKVKTNTDTNSETGETTTTYSLGTYDDNGDFVKGVTVDNTTGKITLSNSVLDSKKVTATGDYTLALVTSGTDKVQTSADAILRWQRYNDTTAKLRLGKTDYYVADGSNIIYKNPVRGEVVVTLEGIKSGFTVNDDGTIDGITNTGAATAKNNTLTLSKDILDTSNVTLTNTTGYYYKLALADALSLSPKENQTSWLVSGTTATLRQGTSAGYKLTSNTGITYSPWQNSTKVTPIIASLTGLRSGLTLDDEGNLEGVTVDSTEKTLTLGPDALTTTDVKLTSDTYSLALKKDVTEEVDGEETVTEKGVATPVATGVWTQKKNTTAATYTLSTTAGYTLEDSDKTVAYNKATKTAMTLNGVAKNLTISNSETNKDTIAGITVDKDAKTFTLGSNALTTANVSVSGGDFTLKLDDASVSAPHYSDPAWTAVTNKGVAYYRAAVNTAGYTVSSNDKSIIYTAAGSNKNLITLSGLKASLKADYLNGKKVEDDPETEDVDESENLIAAGITVDIDNNKVILSKSVLGASNATLGNVVLSDKDNYTLETADDYKASEVDAQWSFNASKGIASLVTGTSAGWQQSDTNSKVISYTKPNLTTIATVSGLNTKATYDNDAGTVEGLTFTKHSGSEAGTITLDSGALGTTKKVTLGKNDNYTLVVAEYVAPQEFENPKWYVTNTKTTSTALLKSGKQAGYVASTDGKTVTLQAETPYTDANALATITGLKKGLKATNGEISGITLYDATGYIGLTSSVLGTTNVNLTGDGYQFWPGEGYVNPTSNDTVWSFSKGTATLKSTATAGFTLSETGKDLTYSAASNKTLATISGLKSSFVGDVGDYISHVPSTKTVTVEDANILGTSTAVLKGRGYALELGSSVSPTDPETATEWVISGTTATYKTHDKPYYYLNNNGAIAYAKESNITNHIVVKGLASGLSASALDYSTNTNTLTLSASQLGNSNVTLTSSDGNKYYLALAADVQGNDTDTTTWKGVTEWVTSGTTATFKTHDRARYTLATNAQSITCNKEANVKNYAVVTGVKTTLSGTTGVDDGVVSLNGSQLNSAVTVSGSYAFNFDSTYEGSITGSAAADKITVGGSNAYINGGKGNDSISVERFGVTILGGAGNDSITLADDDNDRTSGNRIVYANGEGNDSITNFSTYDTLNFTNLAISASNFATDTDGNTIINVNSGKTKGSINLGSYTGDITIIDKTGTAKTYTYSSSDSAYVDASTIDSNELLRDDNYVTMTPQLSSIVNSASDTSLGDLNLNNATSLTQKDTVITYSGDK